MMKYLSVVVLFLVNACASVKAPDGGPKDSAAPKLSQTNPGQNATDFKAKAIVLEFSEDVVENNSKVQFLSPLTSVTTNPLGKRLKITADSGWKPNTTYVLNLRKKIKDEREGNPLKDTTIIFSTGQVLDTISASIQIVNKSNKTSAAKYTALFHNQNTYAGTTDSLKPLLIEGLASRKYLVEVFTDKNDNYQYDEEDGMLFSDSIRMDSSINLIVKPLPQKFKPTKIFKQRKGDTLMIESTQRIEADERFNRFTIADNEEKTLFWLYPVTSDFEYSFSDTLRNCYQDTISLLSIDSTRSLTNIPLKREVIISRNKKETNVQFQWNWQIRQFPTLLEITQDSIWKQVIPEKEKTGFTLRINDVKTGRLKIRFDTLQFMNQMGIRKDSIDITKGDLESFGMVSGKLDTKDVGGYQIELINSAKKTEATGSGSAFQFFVRPGKYTLQVFKDLDGDGQYTGGNKKARRQAEPLYIVPEPIELKPGWDLENIVVRPDF